jgi:hypothetical protein
MAQTVKLKRSSVAGNVPTSGQMTPGELAMNTADGKLFLRDDSDVRPIVTVDAEVTGSLNLIGNITASGDISASGVIIGKTGSFDYFAFDRWSPATDLGSSTYIDWSGNSTNPQLLLSIGGTQVLRASKGAQGDNIIFNPDTVNYNSIIRGATNNNLFFVKASGDRVGINTDDPQSRFHVVGEISASQLSVGSSIENVNNTTRITIDAIPTESISTFRSTGSLTGLPASLTVVIDASNFMDGVDDVFKIFNADTGGTSPVYFKTITSAGAIDITGVGSEADPILVPHGAIMFQTFANNLRDAINEVTHNHASLNINITASVSTPGGFGSNPHLHLESNIAGAAGNNISITTQSNGGSESSHKFFTGGSSTFVPEGGDTITNFIVLDISGSNDTTGSLRRIDFQSFLENTFISQIRDEFIGLSASLAGNGASSGTGGGPQYLPADIDQDGTVGVSDVLLVLSDYGVVYDPNGDRVAGKIVTSSQELPSGSRVSDSTLSAMQDVGFLTEIGGNTIDLTATLASPFIFKGSTLLGTSSKIEFQDVSGGGLLSSSIYLSGSEINIENNLNVNGTKIILSDNDLVNYHAASDTFRISDSTTKLSLLSSNTKIHGPLTASGNISVTGEVSASGQIISDDYRFGSRKFASISGFDSNNISFKTGNSSGGIEIHHITASGDISSSGELIGIINGGSF